MRMHRSLVVDALLREPLSMVTVKSFAAHAAHDFPCTRQSCIALCCLRDLAIDVIAVRRLHALLRVACLHVEWRTWVDCSQKAMRL